MMPLKDLEAMIDVQENRRPRRIVETLPSMDALWKKFRLTYLRRRYRGFFEKVGTP
jgi:hypothetical protein